ncbi:alpha/beta fold hydrolase [Amphritea opalescens]|uniref:Alpha/beta fold hydrolase n=1 Tax=Amphritea opalescens TaxID=2490544 RepID=A0A430KNP8_9GAMM|nr:alpha/beta fold hydrolase [Amphritea opalescens]RTE65092.1 alpha/beta fold hydrolase [Amphritea opalescens]
MPHREATSLVLLHGWGMHSGVWQTLIPELQQTYQVTVIDLPGLGRSAECLPEVYDLDAVVARLAEVAPPSAIWLGWSLGGIIAMAFAQRCADRVEGVITLGSSPCFVERDDWPFGMAEAIYQQFEHDLLANPEKTLQRFNRLQVHGSDTARADLKRLKQIVSEVQPTKRGLSDSLALLRQDYRELYRAIHLPTLHLLCELDTLAPVNMAETLAIFQPQAKVDRLINQSHVGFLSAPESVADKIRQFTL